VACLGALVYTLLPIRKSDLEFFQPVDSATAIEWKAIRENPEVLESIEYPQDLRRLFEESYSRERFLWEGNRQKVLDDYQKRFPLEPSRVLFSMYASFAKLRDSERAWASDPRLTAWDREAKRKEFISSNIPPEWRDLVFPESQERINLTLIWFLEDFVQKHPFSLAKERWKVLKQFRNQNNLTDNESSEYRHRILELVYSREISLMDPLEKEEFWRKRESAWKEGLDFWN